MSEQKRQWPEVLVAAFNYAMSHGARNINALPGCWERQVDEQWWLALNGHGEPKLCSRSHRVPGYSIYLEYNGWPAGVVSANDGWFVHGSAANEDGAIEVLRKNHGGAK